MASMHGNEVTRAVIRTSCRRAGATICPRPGLQRKRAAAALSQAGRAGPDQPIRAIQLAGRPPTGLYATDVRQHHRLMPPGRGHNKAINLCYLHGCRGWFSSMAANRTLI